MRAGWWQQKADLPDAAAQVLVDRAGGVVRLAERHPDAARRAKPALIKGIVSSLAEFGQAFGYKARQPMVRDTRCKIW
jgi:hypothetical protein